MSDNNAITPLEDKPLLNIFATDEDKNGTDLLEMSNFFERQEIMLLHFKMVIKEEAHGVIRELLFCWTTNYGNRTSIIIENPEIFITNSISLIEYHTVLW